MRSTDIANPSGGSDPDNMETNILIDAFNRRITYLRLSVTDRCDFRCTYCMGGKVDFLPRHKVLINEETLTLARAFVSLGVTKIRVTGGEPLVRQGIENLLREIAQIDGLRELVLTTNGSQLTRYASALKNAGVKRVNVSLDSLDPDRFRKITRTGDLHKVLLGLKALQDAGFSRTKLNCVLMRGVNDDELCNLVSFAINHQLDISFIEIMPLGEVDRPHVGKFMSCDEAMHRLEARFELLASIESTGGPARYMRTPGSETRIGFIGAHSHKFCDDCNRVRVDARGGLFGCLGHDDTIDLREVMRTHPGDIDRLRETIIQSMKAKPKEHNFDVSDTATRNIRFMSITGG